MLPWEKKPKLDKQTPYNMERLEELVDELMSELMSDEELDELSQGKSPVVMGFTVRFDGRGKPQIEEFGNARRKPTPEPVKVESRQPLVDLQRDKDGHKAVISVELPGVARKELKVGKSKDSIIIDVKGECAYHKEVVLGEPIDPTSVKATFKNGILEINLKLLPPAKAGDGKEVRIH